MSIPTEPATAEDRSAATELIAANSALGAYDPDAALTHYNAVLAKDRDNVIAAAGRIRALWMLRDAGTAVSELDDLLARAPDIAEVRIASGMVALGLPDSPCLLDIRNGSCDQDLVAAQGAFEEAARRSPGSVDAIRGQATVLRLRGQHEDAIALLDTALADTAAPVVPLLVERSRCHLDLWSKEQALQDLREALAYRPDDVEARLALSAALIEIGRPTREWFAELDPLLNSASPSRPRLAEGVGLLAYLRQAESADRRQRASDRKLAREKFEAVLAVEPRNVTAICMLGWIERHEKGVQPALRWLDAALSHDPHSPLINMMAGWLRQESDREADRRQSLEHFTTALKQAPYLVDAWSGTIAAAILVGSRDEVDRYLAEMEQRFPGHPETLRTAAQVATWKERYGLALILADRAVELDPGPLSELTRAYALFRLGFHHEASDDDRLSAAINAHPGQIMLLWQRAQRAEAEGLRVLALRDFALITDLDPTDTSARQKRRELRGLLWRHPMSWIGGHAIEKRALAEAGIPAMERDALNQVIPDADRVEAARQLRIARLSEARLSVATEWWGRRLTLALFFGGILALIAPVVGHGWLGAQGQPVLWRVGVAAGMLAVYLCAWLLARGERYRLLACLGLLMVGLGVWSIIDPHLRLLWLLVGAPTACVLGQIAVLAAFVGLISLAERRAQTVRAPGVLLRDLIELRQLLERPIRRWEDRDRVGVLLESIAQAQSRVLTRAGRQVRVGKDPTAARRVARRAAGVAAATWDLKQVLVHWDSSRANQLRRWAEPMLLAAAAGEWAKFDWREPDPLPTRLRSWSRRLLVLVVSLVLFAVGGYLLISMGTQAISGLSWHAIVGGLVFSLPVVGALLELVKVIADWRRKEHPRGHSAGPAVNAAHL